MPSAVFTVYWAPSRNNARPEASSDSSNGLLAARDSYAPQTRQWGIVDRSMMRSQAFSSAQ